MQNAIYSYSINSAQKTEKQNLLSFIVLWHFLGPKSVS